MRSNGWARKLRIGGAATAMILGVMIPYFVYGQGEEFTVTEEIFKARVIEIIDQSEIIREDGSTATQQKLKLLGLEGEWRDQTIVFDGTEFDILSASPYAVDDLVLVNYSQVAAGEDNYYIIGYARNQSLLWLVLIFGGVVVAVGKFKGLRALAVLGLTFVIILYFIVPRILAGDDPLWISIVGSLFILVLAVYITEGFRRTSTIAIGSIIISLGVTGALSVWFSAVAKLTGFASEETVYLLELAGGGINIQGLLLAGIVIGALGVLDDVVISQVALVAELKRSNPGQANVQTYRQAMRVGVSHLSSMVNTLFLAYAGAALPLLILFSVKQPPFMTFSQVIDNEMIATEIVRALAGSIGLVLAVPIATLMAVKFMNKAHAGKVRN